MHEPVLLPPGSSLVPSPAVTPEIELPLAAQEPETSPPVVEEEEAPPAPPEQPVRTPIRTSVLDLVSELPRAGDDKPSGPDAPSSSHARLGAGASPSLTQLPLAPYVGEPGQMPPAIRILIPAIRLNSTIVHLGVKQEQGKWLWETPDHAVGHHDGTANPREGSNVVFSGHVSSPVRGEGSVFARLSEVTLGDMVFLETAEGVLPYIVDGIKLVDPADIWVMYPTNGEVLTLITCYPDLVYSQRLVVTASPIPVVIF